MLDRILVAAGLVMLGFVAYAVLQAWHRAHASSVGASFGRPAVIYFRSDACAPCRAQGRFLDQLAAQLGECIAIERIDTDAEPEKAGRYGIFTLPTTLIVDPAGHVRHANYGLADTKKLAAQLEAVGLC